MKILKITLLAFLSIMAADGSAQEEKSLEKRHELKINGFYLILGAVEIDYENIINEESSWGVTATYVFESTELQWGVTPHYRLFFGKKPAAGFFAEVQSSIFGYDNFYWRSASDSKGVAGGIGFAIGAKFKTSKDVIFEIYGGLGRVFGNSYWYEFYPRAGINIGKRF